MAPYPLQGYKVVSFEEAFAGPIVGHLLADMGAEVVRIETPRLPGDAMPRATTLHASEVTRMLAQHFIYRNKLVATLDLNDPEAREAARALIQWADIVIENYHPRVMKGFGLDYASVSAGRPGLIYMSMSAGGQYGPLQDLLGYGPSINSVAGIDGLIGYEDGQLMVNIWDADPTTAVIASFALLAAVHHREKTGQGQFVDVSFFEALGSLLGEAFMDYSMNRRVAGPTGNYHPSMAPHGAYPCREEDTWVTIAVQTEEEWRSFCATVGDPSWTSEPRFSDLFQRLRHRAELNELVARWTRQHTREEVSRALQAAGVAATPVYTLADVYCDVHDRFRRSQTKVDGPDLAPDDIVYGIPWKLSDTPGAIRRLYPGLGHDTEHVLRELAKRLPKRVEVGEEIISG